MAAELGDDGGEFGDAADGEIRLIAVGAGGLVGFDVAGGFPDGFHAEAFGAEDVGLQQVADEEAALGGGAELFEGDFENAPMGFAVADVAGIDSHGKEFEQVDVFEMTIEAVAGDDGVGDDGQPGAGVAEGCEHFADAGVGAGVFEDGLIPEPGEVVNFVIGDAEFHLAGDFAEDGCVGKIAADDLGPEEGAFHAGVMGFEVAIELPHRCAAGAEVVVGDASAAAEEPFGFGAAHAEVDERVAQVKKDGINHALPSKAENHDGPRRFHGIA